ncbi:MAG: hypothetical protein JJE19_05655 [Methanosarcinales archaeon]|nr:hypothetical protein [Methanosarcinales archaeon]
MTFEAAQFKRIYLSPYEEACGVFRGLEKDDYSVSVLFEDFQVAFNSDSTEAKIVEEALVEAIPGEKIAILRTDIPEKPIIVRISKESCPPSLPFISDHRSRNTTKGGSH